MAIQYPLKYKLAPGYKNSDRDRRGHQRNLEFNKAGRGARSRLSNPSSITYMYNERHFNRFKLSTKFLKSFHRDYFN